MKHITERYGQSCNLLEMSLADFCELTKFLEVVGVQIRKAQVRNGKALVQVRNVFETEAIGLMDSKSFDTALHRTESAIENGYWKW